MNLLRQYIKKMLFEWEPANDENMMLDQEGMEKSDRENVSRYLKSMGLLEGKVLSVIPADSFEFPVVHYPPVGSQECLEDLAQVIIQYGNRKVPEALQDAADIDMNSLFEKYLENKGITYNTKYYESVEGDLVPLISEIKNFYNRPRPADTARFLAVDFSGDELESAGTSSYPSGHTIQAYVIALLLGDQFPSVAEGLLAIAELVAQSRIDRGVHFPSDIAYGREVAYLIFDEMKDGSF